MWNACSHLYVYIGAYLTRIEYSEHCSGSNLFGTYREINGSTNDMGIGLLSGRKSFDFAGNNAS